MIAETPLWSLFAPSVYLVVGFIVGAVVASVVIYLIND